ncbi:MAG: acyl-CoA oxidase [Streptosporangiales bacterium]|nr:acyl-CoA oxidase [Streptosporangiales bacterium]
MTAGEEAPATGALRDVLDGQWAAVRALTREQIGSPEFRPVYGLDTETHRTRVTGLARALAKTPGPSLGFPSAYGGADDIGGWITSFSMMAFTDLSLLVKCGVQWGLFGGSVLLLGTQRHHDEYLRQILSMDLPGCFAMTETGHGSDVQSLRTTATYDPDTEEFVVHTPGDLARKDYIGNAARDGRMAVVFAQLSTLGTSHGVHALLVPIRTSDGDAWPGVRIEDCGRKAGLNGVDNGRLWFDEVRVPRTALLNRYAEVAPDGTYSSPIESEGRRFFTMLGTLIQGRVSIAGGAVNAAEMALTIAVRYAERRRQFAGPDGDEILLLDYRQHQRRLLPAIATTYAMHFAQEELVGALDAALASDHDGDHRELESDAAGVKALATWHATRTIQTCREACGGAGYMSENQLASLKADTDVFTTFEGDNTVLLQLVAKGLLTGYRDEFGDLDTRGMVRFVAGQVLESVLEATAVRPLTQRILDALPGGDRDLRDHGYHLELLTWRERHVVAGLARRLKAGVDGGTSPFDAFNDAQDHVLLAARTHVDRLVLEAFVTAIERCTDPAVKALLGKVCGLHALSTIEASRAWYLEHNRLSPERAKAVTRAVGDLCAELRPSARLLVDGFGIPEECIVAPIARDQA